MSVCATFHNCIPHMVLIETNMSIGRNFGYELTFVSAEEIHNWPLTLRLLGIRSTLNIKKRTSTL